MSFNIFRFFLIIFLGIFLARGEQLDCSFGVYLELEYSCSLEGISLETDGVEYEISGEHEFEKTNENVDILVIQLSNISLIPDAIYNEFLELTTLVLTSNDLTGFKTGICGKLQNIWAHSNELQTLQANSFINCEKLIILQLEKNQIGIIETDAFAGLGNLKELTLYDNKLKNLDADTFKGLNSLVRLSLYKNEIKTLDNLVFENLKYLNSLDLGSNQIASIDKSLFNALAFLIFRAYFREKNKSARNFL